MKETLRPTSAEALPCHNSCASSQAPPSYELNDLPAQADVAAPEKAHTPQETAADPAPAAANPNVDVERDTNAAIAARSAQNILTRREKEDPRIFLAQITFLLTILSFGFWLFVVIDRDDFCGIERAIYYGVPGGALAVMVLCGSAVACVSACGSKKTKTGLFWAIWTAMAVLAGAGLVSARTWECGRP